MVRKRTVYYIKVVGLLREQADAISTNADSGYEFDESREAVLSLAFVQIELGQVLF